LLPLPAQMSLSKLNPQCALPAPIGTPNEEAVRPLTSRKGRSKWQVRGGTKVGSVSARQRLGLRGKTQTPQGLGLGLSPRGVRSCLLSILPAKVDLASFCRNSACGGFDQFANLARRCHCQGGFSFSHPRRRRTFPGSFKKAKNLKELGTRARANWRAI